MRINSLKKCGWGILLLITFSCSSHYQLENITRTRIVIDNRFDAEPVTQAQEFLAPYKMKVDSVMGPVVGTVAHDMLAERPESDLSNLMSDILMWAAKDYNETPTFSIYNVGGIRASLAKGKVTYGDVLDIAPFENKICFLTLKGDKVLELFSQVAGRGGEGVSRGVEMVITKDCKLKSVTLNGKPIDENKSYRVTTIDYLAQGNDQLTAFKAGTDVKAPQRKEDNTRFIIMNYFRNMEAQGKMVDAKIEGRVKVE